MRGVSSLLVTGVLVAGLTQLGAAAAAADATDSERIRGYDLGFTIRSDGTVAVVETIEYDFGTFRRHGLTRDIPDRGITDVKVTSPSGAPAAFGRTTSSGEVHLRIGDPDTTVTGRQMYRITYVATAAIASYGDRDELRWYAIGKGWRVPIDTAVARVTAPEGIRQASCYQAGSPCEQASVVDERLATFAQRGLGPGAGMVIVVGLAKGAVAVAGASPRPSTSASPVPRSVERSPGFMEQPGVLSLGIGGAVVAGALLVPLLTYLSRRGGRADSAPGVGAVTSPPDGIPPALAGALRNGMARNIHLMATLLDLAIRGHLQIREADPEHHDWMLVKRREPPADDTLTGFEQRLLDQTFARGWQIRLTSLGSRLRPALPGLHRELNRELAARGWYRGVPGEAGKTLKYAGVWGLLAGVVGGIAVLIPGMVGLAVICAGVALAGAILWLASAVARARLTEAGSVMRARVRAFMVYLSDASEQTPALAANDDVWSRFLPYAMVFGLSRVWARVLVRTVPAGVTASEFAGWYWYADHATDGDLGPAIAGFCDRAGHVLPAVAVSDGGSGLGSGGESFSGGGFSGGGGGGGDGGGGGGGGW